MQKGARRAFSREMALVWVLWSALLLVEASAVLVGFVAYHLWVPLKGIARRKAHHRDLIVPAAERLSQPPTL